MQANNVQVAAQFKPKAAKKYQSEHVFKWIIVFNLVVICCCLPSFLQFRLDAIAANLPVISVESIRWTVAGFLLLLFKFLVVERFMPNLIQHMIHGEDVLKAQQRQDITNQVKKQMFDTVFHSGLSIAVLVMFVGQEWFPWTLGGRAQCVDIFAAFPSWPSNKREQMEGFVMFQLGMNFYYMVELTVFKRSYYQRFNFFELLLHHFVTCTLLIFATMNILPVAISILFLHDFSDLFRALSKVWSLSKWSEQWHKTTTLLDIVSLVLWVYMRVLAFPGCCINSFYLNLEKLDVFGMQPYYMIIMFLCLVLFGLHNFWSLFLVKSAYKRYQYRSKRAQQICGKETKKE